MRQQVELPAAAGAAEGVRIIEARTTALSWLRGRAYDRIVLGLVAAYSGWLVVCAVVRDGSPGPPAALSVFAAGAYWAGLRLGPNRQAKVAAALALGILASALLSGPAALSGGAHAPPLGYGNANGALYVLGLAAASLAARTAGTAERRRLLWGLAWVLTLCTVTTLSKAAIVLAAGIWVVVLLADRLDRRVILLAPIVVAGCVTASVLIGLTGGLPLVPLVEDMLSERRADLWEESLEIAADEPAFGVGPGRFAEASPTARDDTDAQWAHSEYLQVAAETGLPGLVLAVGLLIWLYGMLYRSGQCRVTVLVGTAALTALAVHASVDYVLHFPAVVISGAGLVGLIAGAGRRS